VTIAAFSLASQDEIESGQSEIIGTLLLAVIILTISFDILILLFWDCNLCPKALRQHRLGRKLCCRESGNNGVKSNKNQRQKKRKDIEDLRAKTKVAPAAAPTTGASGAVRAEELRRIRKKFGASSKEYQEAASFGSDKAVNTKSASKSGGQPRAGAKTAPPKEKRKKMKGTTPRGQRKGTDQAGRSGSRR
jgi:hypothetical protein